MAAHTRHVEPPFLPATPPLAELWGLRVWAAARLLGGLPARVRAWVGRPVTNPRPILMPPASRAADTYGRHDRSVGEQTIPLADLLAQLEVPVAPRRRREPPLFGTAPLHEWTHPELYPAVPQRPPAECPLWPCGESTSHFTPDFAQEA